MKWLEIKDLVVQISGLHRDALHVHASVLAALVGAFLLRRSLSSAGPWMFVLVIALLNEALDLTGEVWPTREQQYLASVHDLWNTMIAPTVLLLATRFYPRLFRQEPAEICD